MSSNSNNFKQAFIDSSRRSSGTPENFTINIDNNLFGNRQPQSVKLINATIPVTGFNVTIGNNDRFKFDDTTIVIPSDYYDAASLGSQLQSQLREIVSEFQVTYNSSTQKYTILRTDDVPFTLDFTIDNAITNLLGFDPIVYPPSSSFTSDNATSFAAEKYFGITSDIISGIDNGVLIFQDKNTWPAQSQSYVTEGILAAFPITTCFNSINFTFENNDRSNYQITGNSLFSVTPGVIPGDRKIQLRLVSLPSGNTLSLNGQEWACKLEFQFDQ